MTSDMTTVHVKASKLLQVTLECAYKPGCGSLRCQYFTSDSSCCRQDCINNRLFYWSWSSLESPRLASKFQYYTCSVMVSEHTWRLMESCFKIRNSCTHFFSMFMPSFRLQKKGFPHSSPFEAFIYGWKIFATTVLTILPVLVGLIN